MAYGRGNGGRSKGNFQDFGFIAKNEYKEKDSHPSHRGKLTLSPQLLQYLNDQYENGEELSIEVSGWRRDDNPSMIKLKISKPYTKEDSGPNDRQSRSRPRGGGRRSEEEDDRPQRSRSRDDDEHDRAWRNDKPAGTRGQLTDDMDDDFPGYKGKRSSRRDDDYGDERDL